MSCTQMKAARALWQLGEPKGREFLTPLLAATNHWGDRRFAAAAFALYCGKSDTPLFASWLDDPDWGVREAACQGLERVTGVNIHAPVKPWRKAADVDAPLWKAWYEKEYAKKP